VLAEDWLAMPVLRGKKSEAERFAGAEETYAIEAMMQDRRALQAGTSHFLGQNFAKAYDMQFQGRSGAREHAWSTSWGVSTRLIGGLIMSHSDDEGLVLPPKVAPVQAVIVPIYRSDDDRESVVGKAMAIRDALQAAGIRAKADDREHLKPGAKFFEWEKKGVPVRIELGPRDIEAGTAVLVRRDTGKAGKQSVPIDALAGTIEGILVDLQKSLFAAAKARLDAETYDIADYAELTTRLNGDLGFVRADWCGRAECEAKVKNETTATIRVIPEEGEGIDGICVVCGEKASLKPVWSRSY
jgi:prolyl-tRNA synthetase